MRVIRPSLRLFEHVIRRLLLVRVVQNENDINSKRINAKIVSIMYALDGYNFGMYTGVWNGEHWNDFARSCYAHFN